MRKTQGLKLHIVIKDNGRLYNLFICVLWWELGLPLNAAVLDCFFAVLHYKQP